MSDAFSGTPADLDFDLDFDLGIEIEDPSEDAEQEHTSSFLDRFLSSFFDERNIKWLLDYSSWKTATSVLLLVVLEFTARVYSRK